MSEWTIANLADLADLYRENGDDPHECSMFDCNEPACFFITPEPCGPSCDHMHGIPIPMCPEHVKGHTILGTTGD